VWTREYAGPGGGTSELRVTMIGGRVVQRAVTWPAGGYELAVRSQAAPPLAEAELLRAARGLRH
jgi:hypothetical protein